jgi:hypothetical protein
MPTLRHMPSAYLRVFGKIVFQSLFMPTIVQPDDVALAQC